MRSWLHRATLTVSLPPGVAIDPGGIGKGLGADLVASELMSRGARGALVDLGGDVRVIGDHPDDGPTWTIVIDDPCHRDRDLFRLGFADGGVATSSQLHRRWGSAGGDRHHLLDPASGTPVASPVGAVVVASGTTWWAEVLAKSALLSGQLESGARLIEAHRAVGVLFDFHGEPHDVHLLDQAGLIEPTVVPDGSDTDE